MSTLRRLVPPLAAALAVLVLVQVIDIVACADEAGAVEHIGEPVAGTHLDTESAPAASSSALCGRHGEAPPHDDGPFADCLCHVVFAPDTVVLEVGAQPAPGAVEYGPYVTAPPEVEPLGLDHVPLA